MLQRLIRVWQQRVEHHILRDSSCQTENVPACFFDIFYSPLYKKKKKNELPAMPQWEAEMEIYYEESLWNFLFWIYEFRTSYVLLMVEKGGSSKIMILLLDVWKLFFRVSIQWEAEMEFYHEESLWSLCEFRFKTDTIFWTIVSVMLMVEKL